MKRHSRVIIALAILFIGIALGVGQYFWMRQPAVLVPGTVMCNAIIPGCGYCPDDPRPHCGIYKVSEEAKYGFPFAAEKKHTQILMTNFLIFSVPAVLVGVLVWRSKSKESQSKK